MLARMLRRSWHRNIGRQLLAVFTVFLAASLISSLLTISINIGDKMSRELKSYGANILIEPAQQGVLSTLFGERSSALTGRNFLSQLELANIKDIFWRNNIIGFAPLLSGEAQVNGQRIAILGTFFSQLVAIPDEEGWHTGQKIISPWWQVAGSWPQEPIIPGAPVQVLVGKQLAQQSGWQAGDQLKLKGPASEFTIKISGILNSGGEEDGQLILPLAAAQALLGLQDKIQAIRVSALTVPENVLSRKARDNLDGLNAEEYDLWYCTAYVSSIAHQLADAISGSVVNPVWQVAASEGAVIDKIQLLLVVVTVAALIAAGMGIASLMISSVMERSTESGLMKALGARPWEILMLFYLESVISALLGGLTGCLAGWGLGGVIGLMLFDSALSFAWMVVPCVLVQSILIAVIGTWFATRRIALLHPAAVLYGR